MAVHSFHLILATHYLLHTAKRPEPSMVLLTLFSNGGHFYLVGDSSVRSHQPFYHVDFF